VSPDALAAVASTMASGAIPIAADERELVLEELAAVTGSLHDPAARQGYAGLALGVAEGEVAGEEVARLESLLELTLGTGRARRFHGPEGERRLLRLYQQTPRGAAIRERTDEANRALSGLAGQALQKLSFTALGPGVYRLEIATDRCQVTLETGRLGVTVDSLGVEL